ncbi:ABC-2 transporter permease [Paenibacillus sp. HJL G12]|uniref:ABC-2 transporter permease n=1 Tax=Paenibacillus dendrobii TaxID=2691084 RepID=A0A7X3IEN8_9BACL|nr:ABC-2 transporter permease [Paenibacillus dendrobii]MWV42528.1 ABC-2 transporter permease [Paenibacillus dendrobii]
MIGLLIKDFKLMQAQKNFFICIFAIAIVMAMFIEDSSFIVGFMTFIGLMFTLSTISYDEFDNGNAFMFSLPITRKDYIVEKYGFGLVVGGGSWLLATMISVVVEVMKNSDFSLDTIMSALTMLPVMLIILAVLLPFQLKFGGEKAKVAIIGAFGVVFIIGIIIVKIANLLNIDLISFFNNLPVISVGMLIVLAVGIPIILLLLSAKISLSVMNKKEF